VKRVQAWRKTHPGYWRIKPKPLQDAITTQHVDNKQDEPSLIPAALQDVMLMQPAVLVGVIATLTGSALQDVIARQIQAFHHRGQQILHPKEAKGNDERKSGVVSGAGAQNPASVQLGGSPVGPLGFYSPV
jgi:hypothetical protein